MLVGILYVFIWASAFTAARVAVLAWPPLWALTARFVLVVPLLLAVILVWRGPPRRPSGPDAGRLAVLGAVGTGGYLACSWTASRGIPSGLVALLAATAPLFVAVGERVLHDRRLPAAAWAGLLLGWAGVALLGGARALGGGPPAAIPTDGGFVPSEAGGIALVLAGAVLQAAGVLAFAPARKRVDPWTANLGQTAAAALALLPAALLLDARPGPVSDPAAWAALAYSVAVVGVLGYALFFVTMERLSTGTAMALQLLAPPVAAGLGWLLLGERLAWTDLAGGAVTLAGLWLMVRAKAAAGLA